MKRLRGFHGVEAASHGSITSPGFTLMETLVCLAIMGIMMTLALPTWEAYRLRTGRSEAKTGLLDVLALQERYFAVQGEYSGSARPFRVPSTTAPAYTTGKHYQLRVSTISSASRYSGFTAIAEPLGMQAADSQCYAFTLTHTGVRGIIAPSGEIAAAEEVRSCWER